MQTSLVLFCALPLEAEGIIRLLDMKEVAGYFDSRLGLKLFLSNIYPGVCLVLFGQCKYSGSQRIGTQIASLACWESIRMLNPSMVGSVGTAGGFKRKGASIGDVFLSNKYIYFHGRHIPVPGYKMFELGQYPVMQLPVLPGLDLGIISSSDSVPASKIDMERMEQIGTDAKDMEAAAIAETACMANVPMFAIKAITDFVDSEEPTYEQFAKNYALAIESLTSAVGNLLPRLIQEQIPLTTFSINR